MRVLHFLHRSHKHYVSLISHPGSISKPKKDTEEVTELHLVKGRSSENTIACSTKIRPLDGATVKVLSVLPQEMRTPRLEVLTTTI